MNLYCLASIEPTAKAQKNQLNTRRRAYRKNNHSISNNIDPKQWDPPLSRKSLCMT